MEGLLLLSDQQGGVGRAVGPRLEPGTSYRPVSGPLSRWAEGGRESRAVLPQERVGSYVRTSAFSPFGCLLPPFLSAALPLLSVVAKMTTSYVLGCK